jgi:hypothetical protein
MATHITEKQKYQDEQLKAVLSYCDEIKSLSKKFHDENKNTWFGELGSARQDLEDIFNFLNSSVK